MRDARHVHLDVLASDRTTHGGADPLATFRHVRFLATLARDDHDLRYLGPTLRGALGYALKAVACSMPHRDCSQCLLGTRCAYPVVFDGEAAPSDRLHGQPFSLEVASPDTWWGERGQLAWGLRLYGEAAHWLPHVVAAFLHAGREGLGTARVTFEVTEVFDAADNRPLWKPGDRSVGNPSPMPLVHYPLPHGPCTLRWRFHTPVQLISDGSPGNPGDGMELVLAGRRRFGALHAGHGWRLPDDQRSLPRLSTSDFRTLDASVAPWAIERFSGRQRRRVPLRGVLGEAVIHGPWHLAGAWLGAAAAMHLGKHPTFGLGRVTWEVIET